MTNEQAFDQAFRPELTVEPRGSGFALVTEGNRQQLVCEYYCPFCEFDSDNTAATSPWCEHKEAAFGDGDDAQDQYETCRDALGVGIQ